jgi:predicted metal-dependent peptidase
MKKEAEFKPQITPEELDNLEHPERIFRSLLSLASLPEDRKAFIRRVQELFLEARMSSALYSKVLAIAFMYQVTTRDLREHLGELAVTEVQGGKVTRLKRLG